LPLGHEKYYIYPDMDIEDILVPKSLKIIRREVPQRFSSAVIVDQFYDLNSGKKYQSISNFWENGIVKTEKELFNAIISAFRNGDEIISEHEIYYGEFNYRDYIITNELFKPVQIWDLLFCMSLFDGEDRKFELRFANKSKQEYYWFSTKDISYKENLLSLVKDLELVKLHLKFSSLGGNHEIPSRFTDLVQRAGWENGIKMVKAIICVLEKLQDENIIGKDKIETRISDRLQSDDHDIIYKFYPGDQGHQIVTRHLFVENATSVRVFQNDDEVWNEQVFNW